MNETLVIREKIEETAALIARLEHQLTVYPNDRGIRISLNSLEKRKRKLEGELAETSAPRNGDVRAAPAIRSPDQNH